jgi:predicted transcriptional regulator
MERNTDENVVSEVARAISNETRISFKQATALLMREILNKKDKEIAEVLDVAPASTSSYVSTCREKFDSVDEEIAELEQRIEEWEKTEQLEGILDRFDAESTDTSLQQLSETIQRELVDDEDVTYLIAYVDEQGEEKVQSVNTHPRNIEDNIEDKEVLQYKRISSVEEVFE